MATEKISYERLFNLGGYEHEKFIVTTDAEGPDRLSCFKDLHTQLIKLEAELSIYRKDVHTLMEMAYLDKDAKAWKKVRFISKRIKAFEEAHKPVEKACKCFYCTHPDYDENQEYDDLD